jgi:hypothetical protein
VRLAALIGCRVFDAEGVEIGGVHDVRFQADGPPYLGTGKPAYRVTALLVGDVGAAHRLGYAREDMVGPALLVGIFRRLAKRSYVVEWRQVSRVDRPRIELAVPRGQLRRLSDEPGGEQ